MCTLQGRTMIGRLDVGDEAGEVPLHIKSNEFGEALSWQDAVAEELQISISADDVTFFATPINMKIASFLVVANLCRLAAAGGYAGALERVFVWQVYQIDGLNDPSQRTIGFSCVDNAGRFAFDSRSKTCNGQWKDCGTIKRSANGRCSFSELMQLLDDETYNANRASDRRPPPADTAKEIYNEASTRGRPLANFEPARFLQTTNIEWPDAVNAMGKAVTLGASRKAGNADLFDGLKDVIRAIREARRGDHSPSYTKAARRFFGDPANTRPENSQVVTKPIGPGKSPVLDRRGRAVEWRTPDWAEMAKRKGRSVADLRNDFHRFYYKDPATATLSASDIQANSHRYLLKTYRMFDAKVLSCI